MFTSEQATFLEISEKENKILSCILSVPKNVFRINKDTGIPRATLYLALQRLYRRGFVKAKMDGKRCVFQTTTPGDLKYKFEELTDSL